jgi:ElaB/YqjD/DUF883 family membrane-anchored ribosome-binding protein
MEKQKLNEGSGSSMSGELGTSGMSQQLDRTASELHRTIDKAADGAHHGVDTAQGALTAAGSRVEEKSRELSQAYRHFAETGRDYVRGNPATSVLVALAAGYTLSKLLNRRH